MSRITHYGNADGTGPLLRVRNDARGHHVEVLGRDGTWRTDPARYRDILNGNVQQLDAATAARLETRIRDRDGR